NHYFQSYVMQRLCAPAFSLLFYRLVMVVVRLGDRSNASNYGLPMISLIVAVENIAIRGAGEESAAAVPNIHCHTFDIGTNVLRQTLAQDVPSPAAVSAT